MLMKTNFKLWSTMAILILLGVVACQEKKAINTTVSTLSETDQKVDSVLALMTLQEKIGQLNLYNGFWDVTGPVPENDDAQIKYEQIKNGGVGAMLNITTVEKVREAQRLCVENSRLKIPMLFGYDIVHGYQTMMPIPLAESATWDTKLIEKTTAYVAKEATASGLNWTFAPMVDISHDARWGRVMEGAGEDPYLGSEIAVARVKGFQGDLSSEQTMAACVKHFAGYGYAEGGRDYNSGDFSNSTLFNIILPPFKAASEAGAASFMNAFNDIGGTPATGSSFLQRDILKGDWDYKGFVVSDWASAAELVAHGVAKDNKEAAEIALNAGSDMDMEGKAYIDHLEELVKEGKVTEANIDDAVRRILKVKFELGLFDDPYKYCNAESEKEIIGSEEGKEVALKGAQKAIVLLKNKDNILPLNKEEKIALIGPLAEDKDSPLGSWRGKAITNSAVSVLEGIQNEIGSDKVNYTQGCRLVEGKRSFIYELKINETDKTGFKEAIALAKTSDKVVMVLGEDCFQSGEARSRTDIKLPGVQQDLLKEVYKVNPNIILVLMNGRALDLSWEDAHIPAIVETWHLGSMSGTAIADVLFGDVNPSGKTTVSFPYNVGQMPMYYNMKNTGRPQANEFEKEMVFYSHYSDAPKTALYPFGYGLSYTSFSYSEPQLSTSKLDSNGVVEVSVTIENTGDREGEEVVQLYIRDLVSKQTRPVKELKGFEKINLTAGASEKITFQLKPKNLGYFLSDGTFSVESGEFEVMVGPNSRDLQKAIFSLK